MDKRYFDLEHLCKVVDVFGGHAEGVKRVVVLRVDLEALKAQAFRFIPLLEEYEAGGEKPTHARRRRRFLARQLSVSRTVLS